MTATHLPITSRWDRRSCGPSSWPRQIAATSEARGAVGVTGLIDVGRGDEHAGVDEDHCRITWGR